MCSLKVFSLDAVVYYWLVPSVCDEEDTGNHWDDVSGLEGVCFDGALFRTKQQALDYLANRQALLEEAYPGVLESLYGPYELLSLDDQDPQVTTVTYPNSVFSQ